MSKKRVQAQIRMCGDNGDPFIATLHTVLLAPDLCDGLSLIIELMNSGHTFYLTKGFAWCTSTIRRKMRRLCHIVHRENTNFWKKLKKRTSQRKQNLENKLILNHYTTD